MTAEEEFEEIINNTLTDMASVRCSIGEYQSALQWLIEEAKASHQNSVECSGEQE